MSAGRPLLTRIARLRVPLGFLVAALAFWLATPTPGSIAIGMTIAGLGEALRVWAAGHIEKGREITRSGPYRLVRHPLYLGSAIMAIGFCVAAQRLPVVVTVMAYVMFTMVSAVLVEEAVLDARFAGEYAAYREGRAAPAPRTFSLARAVRNREHRAVFGLIAGAGLLYFRWVLRSPG